MLDVGVGGDELVGVALSEVGSETALDEAVDDESAVDESAGVEDGEDAGDDGVGACAEAGHVIQGVWRLRLMNIVWHTSQQASTLSSQRTDHRADDALKL